MKTDWKNAKWFKILGYEIPVVKSMKEEYYPRNYYTQLHKNGNYIASMGSDMPTHLLAALETYFKRGKLLDDQL